jgi:ABC-2 type transport system ATP-binding protein
VIDEVGTDGPPAVVMRDVSMLHAGGGGVERLDLTVPRGGIFGVVGPSGSGKTTTVELLLGLIPPDDGEITVLGEDPRRFSASDRQRLGYLPQESVLYPELSLRHNLNFVASLYGMPWRAKHWPKSRAGKRARGRVDEVLELLDLEERAGHRLRELSGGEKRRLALATALVHDPTMLILDEPTTGIDPVLRQDLWRHFAALREDGRTLVVTTQYVAEAAYCDLVAVLVEGRVLTVASPEQLRLEAFGAPMLEFVFSRPLTRSETEELTAIGGIDDVDHGAEPRSLRVMVTDADAARRGIEHWAAGREVEVVDRFQTEPSFDEVFVQLVERHRNGADARGGGQR